MPEIAYVQTQWWQFLTMNWPRPFPQCKLWILLERKKYFRDRELFHTAQPLEEQGDKADPELLAQPHQPDLRMLHLVSAALGLEGGSEAHQAEGDVIVVCICWKQKPHKGIIQALVQALSFGCQSLCCSMNLIWKIKSFSF